MPLKLLEIQRQFQSAMLGSKPLSGVEKECVAVAQSFETRFGIYASAYFIRVCDSLIQDFPKVYESLGDDLFKSYVSDFSKSVYSKHRTLGEWSSFFPEFLEKQASHVSSPWLGDLARLEWALVLAEHRDELSSIDVSFLSELPEESFEELRAEISPFLQTISSPWNLDEIYEGQAPRSEAQVLVIVPHSLELIQLSELEQSVFSRMLRQQTLGEMARELSHVEPEKVGEVFLRFTQRKWLSKLSRA